jgi:hypothetical protein
MEEGEKYEAGPEPNAPGPDTPPEQTEPQQEPPASVLHVRFEGPGIANIVAIQTTGEVTLGQLTYLGVFLLGQALANFLMPAMAEVNKAAMLEALKEAFSPKIEAARGNFRIPPDLMRGVN